MPDEHDQWKFEALGRVQCHERHARIRIVFVCVRDERGMIEKF